MAATGLFETSQQRIATSVRVNSDTMEDWLASSRPAVREGALDTCFDVFGEGTVLELLTVDPDNRLLHIRPGTRTAAGGAGQDDAAAEKSDSAWKTESVSVPDSRKGERWERGAIDEVRGFRQGPSSYALVHFPEKTADAPDGLKRRYIEPMKFDPASGWTKWEIEGEAGLALMGSMQTELFVDRNGRTLIYGKPTGYSRESETFALVFEDEASGTWKSALARFPKTSIDYTYRLAANTDSDPLAIGTLFRLGDGSRIEYQTLRFKAGQAVGEDPLLAYSRTEWKCLDLGGLNADVGNLGAARFLDLPDQMGSFVVHSASTRKLYLICNIEGDKPVCRSLNDEGDGPQSVSLVRVARDDSAVLRRDGYDGALASIFVIDATDERRLWVKRQSGAADDGAPSFKNWSGMGGGVRTIAAPRYMPNGAEWFAVHEQAGANAAGGIAIEHNQLADSGEAWHALTIEAGHDSVDNPEKCVVHACEMVLTDKDGVRACGAQAFLTASYACTAVVNGVARQLSSTEPVTVFADKAGVVMVKIKADSVDAPVFSIRLAEADAAPREARADSAAARRLAGRETGHKIDQDRLCDVGLIPESMRNTEQGKQLASMVREAGKQLGQSKKGALTGSDDGPWFYGSFATGDAPGASPRLTMSSGRGAMPADLKLAGVSFGTPPADGFFLFDLIADAIRWVASTVKKVVNFAVKVISKGVEFIIYLGEKAVQFVVETAQGLTKGMEALFQAIANTVGTVIDAAKALIDVVASFLDVSSIMRANDCAAYVINGGLVFLEQTVRDGLSKLVHDASSSVVKRVDDELKKVETLIGNMTLGEIGSTGIPDKEKGGSSFQGKNDLIQTGGVQARWVGDRITTHSDRFGQLASADLGVFACASELEKRLSALQKEFDSENPDPDSLYHVVSKTVESLKADLSQGVQAFNLGKVFTLVRAVIKLGSRLLTEVLDILFELIAEAIGKFREFLNLEIDIPGVTQLAYLVIGRKLKVMDLFTFMFAVAMSVFGKVVNKGKDLLDKATTDKLLKSGLLPAQTADDTMSVPAFGAYLRVKLNPPANPEDEAALKKTVADYKGVVAYLTPVLTCLNLGVCVINVSLGAYFSVGADIADSVQFGAGSKYLGWMGGLIGGVTTVLGALNVLCIMVRDLTITYDKDSAEAKKWATENSKIPSGGLPSLSWVVSALCGVVSTIILSPVSAVALMIPEPINWYANAAFVTLLGALGFCAAAVYTGIMIGTRISSGQISAWQVANEIGMIIGLIPLCLRFIPPVSAAVGKIPEVGTIIAGVLVSVLALAETACIATANIISFGETIDENCAKEWRDFGAADDEMLAYV